MKTCHRCDSELVTNLAGVDHCRVCHQRDHGEIDQLLQPYQQSLRGQAQWTAAQKVLVRVARTGARA